MKTILIVEDTMTEAIIIKDALSSAGFQVLQVGSSEEAKITLASTTPDLIVTDIVLPGESGFELCRSLKDTPATENIPVVVCSTKDSDMDKFWGMKQGASAYLTKPISQSELVQAVQKLT